MDEPRLTVSGAARRLGIAPGTLRTWDRRYGIGPTDHTRGRHRRYSAVDMARLELMQHALVQGASPAEAARYAHSAGDAAGPPAAGVAIASSGVRRVRPDPGAGIDVLASLGLGARSRRTAVPDRVAAGRLDGAAVEPPDGEASPRASSDPAADLRDREADPERARGVGGTLRLVGASRTARGLGHAALAMNAAAIRMLLDESVASTGLMATFTDVVEPVVEAVDRRYAVSGRGLEVRRLLAECVTLVAHARAHSAPPAHAGRPVLLAGAPGERDGTALVVLAAALAERRIACLPLGPGLAVPALVSAVRRTAPAVVVLWSGSEATADLGAVSALPVTRPRFRTHLAGPGWAGAGLPRGVTWQESLAGSEEWVVAMVGR